VSAVRLRSRLSRRSGADREIAVRSMPASQLRARRPSAERIASHLIIPLKRSPRRTHVAGTRFAAAANNVPRRHRRAASERAAPRAGAGAPQISAGGALASRKLDRRKSTPDEAANAAASDVCDAQAAYMPAGVAGE